jgi:hypothetical protein
MAELRIDSVLELRVAGEPLLGDKGPAVAGGAGDHDLGKPGRIGNAEVPRRERYSKEVVCLARSGGAAAVPIFDLLQLNAEVFKDTLALYIIEF